MTAADLLHEIHADGLQLALTESGNIKVKGETDQIQKWTPAIKQHKPELVQILTEWDKLESAVHACCDARKDSEANRQKLLDDCYWQHAPGDWPALTRIFNDPTSRRTH